MLNIQSPVFHNSDTGTCISVNSVKVEKFCHFMTADRRFPTSDFCLSSLLLQHLPQTFRVALVSGIQQEMSDASGNTALVFQALIAL